MRLARQQPDEPSMGSTRGSLRAEGSEAETSGSAEQGGGARDFGSSAPGKLVGAVAAAVKVLRALHASERPLNASAVARATGLYRGTAYNILRTLQAEGFVSYDEPTRTYSVSLHILELAHGVLRRSGLMDLARPLMHEISGAYRMTISLSKVVAPSSLLLLDWVGAAFRTDQYVTVGRQFEPRGSAGVIMAAFGNSTEPKLEELFSQVAWYQKPSFTEFLTYVREAKTVGFAVDRGATFQGVTMVSVPVFSPSWELLLILTALGHSHDLDDSAVVALSRDMQSSAARLSESARMLRLG